MGLSGGDAASTFLERPSPGTATLQGCGLFGIRSGLIAAGLAVLHEEDDEDDETDERDEADKHPPSAAAGVVESADGQGESGEEHRQAVNHAEGSVAALTFEAEDVVDDAGQIL